MGAHGKAFRELSKALVERQLLDAARECSRFRGQDALQGPATALRRDRTGRSAIPTSPTTWQQSRRASAERLVFVKPANYPGATALYMTRQLNVPPARIPGDDDDRPGDLLADPETIRAALLDAFDRRRQVDFAARLVARHLGLGHSPHALAATLGRVPE